MIQREYHLAMTMETNERTTTKDIAGSECNTMEKRQQWRKTNFPFCHPFLIQMCMSVLERALGKFYYCHANNKTPLKATTCYNVNVQVLANIDTHALTHSPTHIRMRI